MIIDLRTVRGQLAALELIDQAECNPDFDQIMWELGISEHMVQAFEPLVVTNGFFESGRFKYDTWG